MEDALISTSVAICLLLVYHIILQKISSLSKLALMSFGVNLVRVSLPHSHPLRVADRGCEALVGSARRVVRGVTNMAESGGVRIVSGRLALQVCPKAELGP